MPLFVWWSEVAECAGLLALCADWWSAFVGLAGVGVRVEPRFGWLWLSLACWSVFGVFGLVEYRLPLWLVTLVGVGMFASGLAFAHGEVVYVD